MPPAEKDAIVAALTPPMMEMLRTRFPAWVLDDNDYRYVEFIDRVSGIAAKAGLRVLPPVKGIA